jgi:hypothetical protein
MKKDQKAIDNIAKRSAKKKTDLGTMGMGLTKIGEIKKPKLQRDKKADEAFRKARKAARGTVTGKGGRNVGVGENVRANVTREQLKDTGLTLRQYLNFMDKNDGKRPPKVATKRMGGMMKSKGMAKGGAMKKKGYAKGGAAGFPDMTGDGKVTKKDILRGRGVPGFSKGALVTNVLKDLMKLGARKAEQKHGKTAVNKAKKELNKISGVTPTKKPKTEKQKKLAAADSRAAMTQFTKQTPAAKKQAQVKTTEKRLERGFKNGGMAKKGYSKGGAARKSKPRGVGAALRGYGKALR